MEVFGAKRQLVAACSPSPVFDAGATLFSSLSFAPAASERNKMGMKGTKNQMKIDRAQIVISWTEELTLFCHQLAHISINSNRTTPNADSIRAAG